MVPDPSVPTCAWTHAWLPQATSEHYSLPLQEAESGGSEDCWL